MVDRRHKDFFISDFPVANGRQVYFPLPDGSFLGVKGAGYFSRDDNHPFIGDRGLVDREEVDQALAGYRSVMLKGGSFVPLLATRQLYFAPDGRGGMSSGPKPSFLVFNHFLTPHRLNKLAQILETDPGLRRFCKRLSHTLHRQGKLPEWSILTQADVMQRILSSIVMNAAIKLNVGLNKETLHTQDISLAGEEADNEEFKRFKLNSWDNREFVLVARILMHYSLLRQMIVKVDLDELRRYTPEKAEDLFRVFLEALDTRLLLSLASQDSFLTRLADTTEYYDSRWESSHLVELSTLRRLVVDQIALRKLRSLTNQDNAQNTEIIAGGGGLPGGIDLHSSRLKLETTREGKDIRLHLDPAQLQQMQNASGFTPVIINIQPMSDLRFFLGLQASDTDATGAG